MTTVCGTTPSSAVDWSEALVKEDQTPTLKSGSPPEKESDEKTETEEKREEEDPTTTPAAPLKDYGVELNSYIVLNECM